MSISAMSNSASLRAIIDNLYRTKRLDVPVPHVGGYSTTLALVR